MQLLVVKAGGYDEQRSESQDWRENGMGRERASQASWIGCFMLSPKMCRKIEETSSKARQASWVLLRLCPAVSWRNNSSPCQYDNLVL
jgi:hypothetical protein